MIITNKRLSRRTVLKGMGVTVALPFLEAMVPARSAFGAASASRKIRLVAIEMVHGSAGCAAFGTKSSPSLELSMERDQTKFTVDEKRCQGLKRRLVCREL